MGFISRLLAATLSALLALSNPSLPFSKHPTDTSGVAEKLQVLDALGIEFSEETGLFIEQSIEQWIDEMAARFTDGEMDFTQFASYPAILSMLGTGKYDEATHSLIPVTNSVYAFDAECFDIVGAYGDFLIAVSRISNGEIRIDDYHSDVDMATFEAGKGIQEVTFNFNEKLYHFTAQFYYDWMDCTIIDYVNLILDEQGIDKRLWCMFDGGQGFVVFYNTTEWAREFSNRTGCALAVKAKGAL